MSRSEVNGDSRVFGLVSGRMKLPFTKLEKTMEPELCLFNILSFKYLLDNQEEILSSQTGYTSLEFK